MLLAGYDIVTQIGARTLQTLIRNTFQLGGTSLVPPFNFHMPVILPGINGNINVIVFDIWVNIKAADVVVLRLPLHYGTVDTDGPVICPLEGIINIPLVPAIEVGDDQMANLVFTFTGDASIEYSEETMRLIQEDLQKLHMTPDGFKNLSNSLIRNYVTTLGPVVVALNLPVTGQAQGSLTGGVSYVALEVHGITDNNVDNQSLALCGYLRHSHLGRGRHADLQTNIHSTQQIAISISPDSFTSFVFCPGLAAQFQQDKRERLSLTVFNDTDHADLFPNIVVNTGELPAVCGAAKAFEMEGVELTGLHLQFLDGVIGLYIGFQKSAICYTARGSNAARITLEINSQGEIHPIISMDDPEVDFDVDIYCTLAAYPSISWFSFILSYVLDCIGTAIAKSVATKQLHKIYGGVNSTEIPRNGLNLLQPVFTNVNVNLEGLHISGRTNLHPFNVAGSQVNIASSTRLLSHKLFKEGIWNTKIFCESKPDDFPWKAYHQQQEATLKTTATLAPPLHVRYSLRKNSEIYPINNAMGDINIPAVYVSSPLPLENGGIQLFKEIQVGYQWHNETLILHNRGEDCNYSVEVLIEILDCKDRVIPTTTRWHVRTVFFTGVTIDLENNYIDRVKKCQIELLRSLRSNPHLIHAMEKKLFPKNIIPLGDPSPEELFSVLGMIAISGLPGAEKIIQELKRSMLNNAPLDFSGKFKKLQASPDR